MSIKRQIKFKYTNLVNSLQIIGLPSWATSRTARLALFSIIFFFSAAYIVKTTSAATSGYQVHDLEKQTAALENDVQKIQVEIADNSSIVNISSRLTKLNMVDATSVKYLTGQNTVVAKK